MQTIAIWLLIGLLAGGIGGLAIHARGIAVLGYVIAGFAGAVLGGMVAGKLFGIDVLAQLTLPMLIESVLGALALVIVLRRLPQRERAPEWHRRT
jgi:uncharacterized membrane protein YeaQ/YmgE (transglycosylase-associated protein family)